ncbi:MAG TPA: HEPN domain-containing protein [Bryobacteraceae bacterium]|nr:HEPN domain-containing protein [Bryobacteraceae bacterium]
MQKALLNLKTSVQRVRDIACDIDNNASAALANPTALARHETTQCAATVILSGFLESFMRETAEGMISEICARNVPFQDLPDKIRVTHFLAGGYFLHERAKYERKTGAFAMTESANVVRRLASVGIPQPPYELLWEAFADTQANPGPDAIGDFLRNFDVQKPIPALAAAMNVSANTLVIRLRSFIEVRNECAHTGSSSKVPTTSDIQDYCDLVEQTANGIVLVLQTVLARAPFALPTINAQPPPAVPPPTP